MSQYQERMQALKAKLNQQGGPTDGQVQHKIGAMQDRRQQRNQNQPQTPLPWNSQYESTVSDLGQQRDTTLTGLAGEQYGVEQSFGFNNPSDPFSRARQIQEGFDNAKRGTGNNYAAAGQLYAGSLSNARDIDQHNYDLQMDAARKEYDAMMRDLAQRRLEAQTGYDSGVSDAAADSLADAVAEPTDPSEAPRNKKRRKGKH